MRLVALVPALLLALAACGSGDPPAPPDDGGDGGGTAGGEGDGGGDAGGGSGGGEGGDAGSGGGGGSADDGSPDDDGGSSGGGGSDSGPAGGDGSGDGGSPGGDAGGGGSSVVLERLSDHAECEGLLPASAPEPVVVRRETAGACLGGTSDGTGAVALAAREGNGVRWQVHARDGRRAGAFPGAEARTEPRGWHVLRVTPGEREPLVEVVAVEPDGRDAQATTVSDDPAQATGFRWSFAQDPLGGSFVLFRSVSLHGNHWHALRVHRLDAGGGPRWPGGVLVRTESDSAEPFFMAAGVSNRGDALVVHQDSAYLVARWITRDGEVLGPDAPWTERSGPVVGEGLEHDLSLKPLLDGSLALRSDGTWRRVYPYHATETSPLPGWLTSRAAWDYQLTRGNRGYALFPPPGEPSPDCTQAVELLAPSGRLCGRVILREEGSGCTAGRVDQGWDGTVVQQSGKDACTYRWWPRLLAGG